MVAGYDGKIVEAVSVRIQTVKNARTIFIGVLVVDKCFEEKILANP